jgi:hypothetical protein
MTYEHLVVLFVAVSCSMQTAFASLASKEVTSNFEMHSRSSSPSLKSHYATCDRLCLREAVSALEPSKSGLE